MCDSYETFHKRKPKYIPVTDQMLLDEMINDKMRYDLETETLYRFHASHKKWITKVPRQHPLSGRWRYKIQPSIKHTQRTIYRSKVAWLWKHRSLIPEGMEIDHIDRDNQNDSIDNLRLRGVAENRRDNASLEAEEYFEEIMFLGREPRYYQEND